MSALPNVAPGKREPLASEGVRRFVDFLQSERVEPSERMPSKRQLAQASTDGGLTTREALKGSWVPVPAVVRHGKGVPD